MLVPEMRGYTYDKILNWQGFFPTIKLERLGNVLGQARGRCFNFLVSPKLTCLKNKIVANRLLLRRNIIVSGIISM